MYSVGDHIVHPMHGAGEIREIVNKRVCGSEQDYYVLKLPVGDMVVMVPVDRCDMIGVRPVVEPEEANRILNIFPDLEVAMTQNWNKRYRENMEKIKSGDLYSVACVVKGLLCRDNERGLSTGERKMLHTAKQILISELVVSLKSDFEYIEEKLCASVRVKCP